MCKVFRVSVLLLALCCPTYAGEVGYGSPVPAPTPATSLPQQPAPQGEMHYPTAAEFALGLLQHVLALF